MLRRLRPQGLDELGLDQALYDLVETWRSRQRQTEWAIETSGLTDQLDDTLRVTIYRIVQECLTNVARHAKARRASVRVAVAPTAAPESQRVQVRSWTWTGKECGQKPRSA